MLKCLYIPTHSKGKQFMSNSSAKVKTLSLKQFTTFSDATFEFSPGINVLIGENATGKSYLMKIIYAILKACETAHHQHKSSNGEKFKGILDAQLHNVFQVHTPQELVRFNAEKAEVDLDYAGTQFHVQMGTDGIQSSPVHLPNPSAPLYLPAREFMSITEGFIAAYQKRELPYDETYYDLSVALNALPLRQNQLADVQSAIELLQHAIVGEDWDKPEIVKQENGRFYFDLPEGYLNVHFVADGYRKLGTLLYLLKNGSLTKDSILFWDEPDANLNPKLTIEVRKVLQTLAEAGMQIFITSHDYLLGYELSLLVEYPSDNPLDIKFFSLYKPERQVGVIFEEGQTLADIEQNSILEEFAAHYDREAALFSQS
jgi:predicted ATPase